MQNFEILKKDFNRYLKDGDKKNILKYSKGEILGALEEFDQNQAKQDHIYKAIKERKREIEREEAFLNLPDIFVGQEKIIEKINLLIEKVKITNKSLPHILLIGNEGMGKETLARIVARTLKRNLTVANAGDIMTQGDLIGILTNLEQGDILLIKDVEKLTQTVKEILYPAIKHCEINFVIDKGPYAKTINFKLNKFTFIGTRSDSNKLDDNLARVFFTTFKFVPYPIEAIAQIVLNEAKKSNITIDKESIKNISEKASGVTADAVGLFNKVVTYAELSNEKLITKEIIQECLALVENEYGNNEKNIDRNISMDVRRQVWRRDSGKCVECGSQEKLEYDHIIPVSKGGNSTVRNIRLLCEKCNRQKKDSI